MRKSSLTVRVVCLLTSVSLICGGCTRTRVFTFAKHQPGADTKVDRTPDVGSYKIKYTDVGGEELKTLRGSRRLLGAGQPIGFERAADGQLIAVAGEERFPALLPPDARFVAWYSKKKEPTQFAESMGQVGQAAVPVLIGVGVIGLLFAAAALDDDDCKHGVDRDDCRRCGD